MIGQIQLVNDFVPGAYQLLNLVSQNKHHAKKCTAILQVMARWRSYIFATYSKIAQYHINLFGYINTYTFMRIVGT